MKTFTVKAQVQFNDGILKGSVKIKAQDQEQAAEMAREKLTKIWGTKLHQITIQGVR